MGCGNTALDDVFAHSVYACIFHILLHIFQVFTLAHLCLWNETLLLRKRNAMHKTHASIGCGNTALDDVFAHERRMRGNYNG